MILAQALGENLDYAVMFGYFIAIMGFGLCFSRYNKTTKDYFFGGQRFSWWLIAFSCIATLVGSYSFIKYSAAGFTYGISSTQTYFNDWFWVPLLVLVWIPIVYYRRIQSIPEYMEVRFNKATRVAATVIILLYIVGYIGINLVTLGQALHTLLGWKVMTGAAVTAVAVAIYVYAGGQTAVIMTDLAQGIILLIAGLGLFVGGIYHFGGFGDMLLPQSHKYAFGVCQPAGVQLHRHLCPGRAGQYRRTHADAPGLHMCSFLKSVHDSRRMVVAWIYSHAAGGDRHKLRRLDRQCSSTAANPNVGGRFLCQGGHFCRPGVLLHSCRIDGGTHEHRGLSHQRHSCNLRQRHLAAVHQTQRHGQTLPHRARITSSPRPAGFGAGAVFMQKTLHAHGIPRPPCLRSSWLYSSVLRGAGSRRGRLSRLS